MHFQVDDDTIIGSAYALFINTVWGVFWGGGGATFMESQRKALEINTLKF